jgi:membrane protein required for colicin V production
MMLDRLLGVLFGFLRGAVIVALIVMLGRLVELDKVNWWRHSRLLPYATELSIWIRNFADSAIDVGERHKSAAEA